jgi:putative endonuclease
VVLGDWSLKLGAVAQLGERPPRRKVSHTRSPPKDRFMFFVYVLKSCKNGRMYVGSTNNLQRRLYQHNHGQNISTRSKGPYIIVYNESYFSRNEAVQREHYLKTGKGREEIKNLGL